MFAFFQCKEHLDIREKAVQTDYKVDYGLGHACQEDIVKHECVPPHNEKPEVGMSLVILCLEGVIHKKGKHRFSSRIPSEILSHNILLSQKLWETQLR